MKIGTIILIIGIVAICLGLAINSIYGASEGEYLAPSVWHLLWSGVSFVIIDIVFLLPEPKDAKEKN